MMEPDRGRAIRRMLAGMRGWPAGAALNTGFSALDAALGVGGWPRGALVELFGPASSGKTSLMLQTVGHLQAGGAAAAWIDADRSFDAAHAARLGVDLERLPLINPPSAEAALEIAGRLASSGSVDLIIVDSAAALAPGLEVETGIGTSGPGLQSRVLASGLRRLARALARSGAAVVFLNQTRARLEAGPGLPETSAGGAPLKLYAALRVAAWATAPRRVRFRVVKSQLAEPFREAELEWRPGLGFVKTP